MGATANVCGSRADRRGLGVPAPMFSEFQQRRQSAGVETPTVIIEDAWPTKSQKCKKRANLRNASVTFSLFWHEASLG